jgi:hypothetical protein
MARTRRDYQRWARRGTTAQRGYGREHARRRARWKPLVDAGQVMCHAVICLKSTRQIWPGTPWHLGHTPDRTAWTGPEHEQCNESEAAIRGNRARGRTRAWQTSRRW